MKQKYFIGGMFFLASFFVSVFPAQASLELINNGDFETGSLSGWTVSDAGSGTFYAANSNITPETFFPSAGPASGNFYAVSDQSDAGVHALYQSFFVPAGSSSVNLTFNMFANDWAGTLLGTGPVVTSGLDYTGADNQYGRVDILAAGSGGFDTGGAVLQNFFLGADDFASNANPYSPYSFNITPTVGAGGNFILRFAQVNNVYFYNLGVDDVSILADSPTNAVPEPLSMLLLGSGFAGMVLRKRSK